MRTTIALLLLVGCNDFTVIGLRATRTRSATILDQGGQYADSGLQARIARVMDLCDQVETQISLIESADRNAREDWAVVGALVTGLGGVIVGGTQLATDDDSTANDVGTVTGLVVAGLGIIGTSYVALTSDSSGLEGLSSLRPQIQAGKELFASAVNSRDIQEMDRQAISLGFKCEHARGKLTTYGGEDDLAEGFSASAAAKMYLDIEAGLEAEAATEISEEHALKEFKRFAQGLGYKDAEIVWQLRVGAGGDKQMTIKLEDVGTFVSAKRASGVKGTFVLGLYSPQEGPAPAHQVIVALSNGGPSMGTYQLVFTPTILMGTSLEPISAMNPMSAVARTIAIAPYASAVDPKYNADLCATFSVLPPSGYFYSDSSVTGITPKDCPTTVIPWIYGPGTQQTVDLVRQAQGLAVLPANTTYTAESLVIRTAEVSPTAPNPGPGLLAVVWVTDK